MKILRRHYQPSELYLLRKPLGKIFLSPRKIYNFLLIKISSLLKLERSLGLPSNLHIEPTANCNYRCVKCARLSESYRDDGPDQSQKNLSLARFQRIMDDIGDILMTLRLWHFGEPLLNEDLPEMIRYAKRKKIFVVVSSNLSLLTEKTAVDLVDAGLDYLIVSFDSPDRRTYEQLHGEDAFDSVLKNIDLLVQTKRVKNSKLPLIELQLVIMKDNEKEIGRMVSMGEQLGVDRTIFLKLDPTFIECEKLGNFTSESDLLPDKEENALDLDIINKIGFCRNPWEEALIRYSGLVLPCVQDVGQGYKMGRLFEGGSYKTFKTIWNDAPYRRFRKLIATDPNLVDICIGCDRRDNNSIEQETP